jgi:hypothetical protein
VHDIFHAGLLCDVEEVLALAHHVDAVAREHECAIHTIRRRRDGFGFVEIKANDRSADALCFSGEGTAATVSGSDSQPKAE